ncbi:MAG: hypothetical protein ACP5KV_04255, partial [Candidatus Methanomethylicaceae archaeon]
RRSGIPYPYYKHLFKPIYSETVVYGEVSFKGKPAVVLPHPSPANRGWFKRHPRVERRLVVLREMVQGVLKDRV